MNPAPRTLKVFPGGKTPGGHALGVDAAGARHALRSKLEDLKLALDLGLGTGDPDRTGVAAGLRASQALGATTRSEFWAWVSDQVRPGP